MWWKKVTFPNFFIFAAVLSLLTAVIILITKSFLPPVVPLFYGKPTGTDQLAPTLFLLVVPAISLAITAVNVFINSSAKDDFIKKFIAASSLIISVMATVTVVKIILLVGFF